MRRECKGCGDYIPAGRVKAIPNVMVCMDCELQLEKFFKVRRRSTDDVVVDGTDYAEMISQTFNAKGER